MSIVRIQPQCFQCLHTSSQQEGCLVYAKAIRKFTNMLIVLEC